MRPARETLCDLCYEKGYDRVTTIQYRGKKYCDSCKEYWIRKQWQADQLSVDMPALLRKAIKSKGFKFKEVAARCDVSLGMVSRYVSEENPSAPSLETFLRICKAIGSHPNEVLGFTDPMIEQLRRNVITLKKMAGYDTEGVMFLGDIVHEPRDPQPFNGDIPNV